MAQPINNTINSTIERTASEIIDYLVPRILCISDSDTLYKRLRKDVSWLEPLDDAADVSSSPENEIILLSGSNEFIIDSLSRLDQPGRIVIVIDSRKHGNRPLSCTRAMGLRLVSPSLESIVFHIRALLIVQDSLLFHDRESPIFSVDKSYRDLVKRIVSDIYEQKPITVLLEKDQSPIIWFAFLFGNVPTRIRPIFIDDDTSISPNIQSQPNTHYFISTDTFTFLDSVVAPFICFTHVPESELPKHVTESSKVYCLPALNSRTNDLLLLNYLASLQLSFESEQGPHYMPILEARPLGELVSLLRSHKTQDYTTPQALHDLVEMNNRLSLTNILKELEYHVLDGLKTRTQKVKGTSLASGIKLGTLHKKIERFVKERSTSADSPE